MLTGWPAARAGTLMGRVKGLVNGQIRAGNRARFNDWLLKVTFYRTASRTAHMARNAQRNRKSVKLRGAVWKFRFGNSRYPLVI